jgi:serine/threonine protein kinase
VDGKGDDLQNFNVDEYKIIQSIGEGSFGIIYACENIYNKERYALKKIIVNTEEELELFISEFDLIRKVKHKHILNIYGMSKKVLDFSTRVLYIIMELSVSDWDREIKARYKSNGFYKEQELVTMLKQIVEALAFLQGHGISHRDIKPQNILVFPNQVFKIADFGEAKEVKIAKKQMETLRGTELYMSPILFSALRTSDKNNVEHNPYKSDVFSLGYCILYAATLSFKVLYDIRNVNNQKNILNIIKNYLAKKYSSKLVELIARMVDVSEVMRFDFIELNNYLNMNF